MTKQQQKVENGELTEEELAGYEQALAQAQAELEAVNALLHRLRSH